MTKYRLCLIAVLVFSIGILGYISGGFLTVHNAEEPQKYVSEEPEQEEEAEEAAAETGERIGEDTKIVCEYVYKGGHKEYSEIKAPVNWRGLTLNSFKELFDGWQVKEFSSEKVLLSKNMQVYSPNHYVLGIHQGYVAVFSKNGISDEERLRQLTQTPVSALPEDEQNRLKDGIDFYGDEELMKILQDYET